MKTRLDHLVLTVADIEKTCDFYRQLLNLEVITFGDSRKALRVGNQKINLHRVGSELFPCAHNPTPGSADLCFIADASIPHIQSHLAVSGIPVELGPVQRTGVFGPMTSLYVRDPDGNLVEISVYDTNKSVRS